MLQAQETVQAQGLVLLSQEMVKAQLLVLSQELMVLQETMVQAQQVLALEQEMVQVSALLLETVHARVRVLPIAPAPICRCLLAAREEPAQDH